MNNRPSDYLAHRKKQFEELTFRLASLFEKDGFTPTNVSSREENIQYLKSTFEIKTQEFKFLVEVCLIEIEKLSQGYLHDVTFKILWGYPSKIVFEQNFEIINLDKLSDTTNLGSFYKNFVTKITP